MKHAVIQGCGSYLPTKILTNADLEKTLDTDDAWIRERTGIESRHIAAKDEATSTLAYEAARAALSDAGIEAADIDAILLATSTPDSTLPGTATRVQALLGCTNAFAMDVQAACSGFVYALHLADSLIASGKARTILVIGAEILSRIVDWKDRGTCILFGDGAGACVIKAEEGSQRGILHSELASDGTYYDILKTNGGVSTTQTSGVLYMEGKEVFRHAVEKMSSFAQKSLNAAGFSANQVDWVVPHQANARIMLACMKKLGLDEQKLIMTVSGHANTSAASIPLALASAHRDGRLQKGHLVVLTALGAGLTWGSCILRW